MPSEPQESIMGKNNIVANPISAYVTLFKRPYEDKNVWVVTPVLQAFPLPKQPTPRNIIFILDISSSMAQENRWQNVKTATQYLLEQLNAIDTFSLIVFNKKAKLLAENTTPNSEKLAEIKGNLAAQKPNSATYFCSAFHMVKDKKLIKDPSNSTIIFLTDGEDTQNISVDTLSELVTQNKKRPRIIPIGIFLENKGKIFLNNLAKKSGQKSSAIYVDDNEPQAYKTAFQEALDLTQEYSEAPAELEIILLAKGDTHSTQMQCTRTLNNVAYGNDSNASIQTTILFESPVPPHSLKLRFACDGFSLIGEHIISQDNLNSISAGHQVNIPLPQFKWKETTTYSWIKSLGSIALGLLLLSSARFFFLHNSILSLWATVAVGTFSGIAIACLLGYGLVSLFRKTLFLPTKIADGNKIENLEEKSADSALPPKKSSSCLTFFVPTAGLATGGAIGYWGSKAIYAANIALAHTVSASFFIGACTTASAVIVLLLLYCCMQNSVNLNNGETLTFVRQKR
ncbi:MAG: hypothetical protein K0S27_719 [Gammaproteobacteria bacterium]|jgi:hypothetical protein|nr:hypothetical protein [Gammaproteobacteria bacterium]